MIAKAHGMTEECESILAAAGMTEDQISLPSMGEPAKLPSAVVPTYKANWPVKSSAASAFVKALLGEEEGDGEDEEEEITPEAEDEEEEDLLGDD